MFSSGENFQDTYDTFDRKDFSLEFSEGFSLDLSWELSLEFPFFLRDFPLAIPSTCAGVVLNPNVL